jgi:predicted ATPase/class 3 adenylate cyclase
MPLPNTTSSEAPSPEAHTQARPPRAASRPSLAEYIPIDRRQGIAQGRTLPDRAHGAALFADISGFTPLAHAFARELGATRGAEALLDLINPIFSALIGPLHHFGGSVVTFVGDAITCWFDDTRGAASPRAVATALAMQEAMAPFATVRTPRGNPISMSVKVAIAAGAARRFLVGDPLLLVMDVLAGPTLERMALAESQAGRGEVVVSEEVGQELGKRLVVARRRTGPAGQGFAVVAGLTEEIPPAPWPDAAEGLLAPAQIQPWLPPAIREQLAGDVQVLGDLRPVTPLFVKFAGIDYGADDAGEKLDAFVRWVQHVVHRRGGTLLQLTLDAKGTFLYATFGAPVAHEDDPIRAMHAALALHALPADLGDIGALQIGLTRGEVWTGTCGGAGRFSYGVIGTDVNLSARLMAAAEPGQILVTGRLRDHPGAQDFEMGFIGDRRYKGLAESIPTYELRGERLTSGRIFSAALAGREIELQQLLAFAQPLLAGRPAGVVAIYGEAGIGKSHLCYALRQALGERATWFTAQSDQILRQAFNPFVYWLRHYFEQTPSASEQENEANFEARLNQLLQDLAQREAESGDPAISILAAQLVRVRSVLAALLGLHQPGSLYERLDAKGRHENILTAIRLLLLAESQLRPVVLELEDGHWLDEVSHEALTALSRHLPGYPLLVLVTARYADDGSRPTLVLDPAVPTLTLDLNALAPAGLEQLAADVLEGPAAPTLLSLLQEKSQGNPFFAQQVLYYLRENDLLEPGAEGTWRVKAADLALPSHINAILIARIDRLAQQVKEIVQAAAVVGREFQVQVLSQMLRMDAQPIVQQAEQEQIWTALQELRYLFKHALLRDAAYEMQLKARLRQLHRLAAAAYETLYAADLEEHYAILTYHHGQAGETTAERRYAQLAGKQAAARFANEEAVRFFSRALELTPESNGEARLALLLDREAIYALQGNRPAQALDLAALEELAGAAGEEGPEKTARRSDIALRRSRYAEAVGDYPAAILAAQEAIALAQEARDAGLEAMGQRVWGVVLWQQGDNAPARDHMQQALELARIIDQRNLQAECLCTIGCVDWSLGDYAAAQQCYEQSLDLSREVGDRRCEIISLQNLGLALATQGDWVSAQGCYEHSLQIAQEIGYRRGESYALESLGTVSMDQGDYVAARDVYARTLAISREIGDRREEARSYTYLGEICRILGDYAGAREHYTRALEITRVGGERGSEGLALGNLSLIAHNQGDDAAARQYGEQALQIVREAGDRRTQGYVLTALGHALAGQGKWAEADAAYNEALALRRELGESSLVMETLAGQIRLYLTQGDAGSAYTPAREIASYLDEGGTLDGADESFRIYQSCYRALHANADPRARTVLVTAQRLLRERAAQLSDDASRRSFLEQVSYHREILDEEKRLSGHSGISPQ